MNKYDDWKIALAAILLLHLILLICAIHNYSKGNICTKSEVTGCRVIRFISKKFKASNLKFVGDINDPASKKQTLANTVHLKATTVHSNINLDYWNTDRNCQQIKEVYMTG